LKSSNIVFGSHTSDTTFANGVSYPSFHAVGSDPVAGDVYFGATVLGLPSLWRCTAAQCSGNTYTLNQSFRLSVLPTGGLVGRIASAGPDVYYSVVANIASLRQIFKVSATPGGSPIPVTAGNLLFADFIADEQYNDLAVDADFLYYTTKTELIARRLTGGMAGQELVLVTSADRPRSLALDATHVYFTNLGPGTGVSIGRVRRIVKPVPIP
jgi:hypothetical protein